MNIFLFLACNYSLFFFFLFWFVTSFIHNTMVVGDWCSGFIMMTIMTMEMQRKIRVESCSKLTLYSSAFRGQE